MLNKFSEMIRGNLTKIQRQKIVALVTIEVHARDVIEKMIKSGCGDVSAFEWLSQLRLYWDKVLQWHVYLLLFCCLLNSMQPNLSYVVTLRELGSFSNDYGDGNENVKTAIGLLNKNNKFARASRFFVHFFAVTARLRRENA